MSSQNKLPNSSTNQQQQGGNKNANNNPVKAKEADSTWVMSNVRCWYKKNNNREEQYIFRKAIIVSDQVKNVGGQQIVNISIEQENGQNAEQIETNVKNLFQREEQSQTSFYDMVKMSVLNEAELIANLKQRYAQDNIFTYIGPTLIVLNPYKSLKELFSNQTIDMIKENLNKNFDLFDLEMQQPHIYSISAMAYKNLIKFNKKQAIVISGESGAGKTENARYSMRFLTQISTHDNSNESIEEKILSCNPVLEAFGNAKTVRNDNSSRFGKYVQIEIAKKKINGATITKYLLEKSRVIHLSQGERNYHIFYHLLESKDNQLLEKLHLLNKKPSEFQYLSQSDCYSVETIDDTQLFQGIINSFKVMKFEEDLQNTIFKILSAILHLGNIQFSNQSFSEGSSPCTVVNENVLQIVSSLLGINLDDLKKALLYKTIVAVNEVYHKPADAVQCHHAKNTLSKALYDNLFNWLVDKLNQIIKNNQVNYNTTNTSNNNMIGLLDIFGFENFQENSFEQLCINYTNENLQQLYIQYVFKNEEQIFKEDGLENFLSNLCYQDNSMIIQTLNRSYKLLNDCCKTQSKDDSKYLQSLKNDFKNQQIQVIQFPKMDNGTFLINHTQNPVSYKIEGFIAKNIDEVSQTLKDVISKSSNKYIPSIFGNEEQTQQNRARFLGEKFSNQMVELMKELNSSDVHFVRCVKTNEVKKSDYFLEGYVLQQIEYLGVINSIEVRKSTYPQRRDYLTFFKEYRVCDEQLEKKAIDQIKNFKDECKALVSKMYPNYSDSLILFGNNKIYMKQEFESAIDQIKYAEIKRKRTAQVVRIQIYVRYLRFHKRFQKKLEGIKKLNNIFFAQKIFNIYNHCFQLIKQKAKITQVKNLITLTLKIVKASFTKTTFQILKEYSDKMKELKEKNEAQIENNKQILEQSQEEQKVSESTCVSNQFLQRQDTSINETNASLLYDTIAVNEIQTEQSQSKVNTYSLKSEKQQNSQNVNAFDFQTGDLSLLHIPEKHTNEIYVNPPDQEEIESESLLLKLLNSQEIDDKIIQQMKQVQYALDKDYQIQQIDEEDMIQIKKYNYIEFYSKRLNERSKFFGKKTTEEILTFKKTCIKGGSLIKLPSSDIAHALTHFEILLLFIKETDTIKYSVTQQYQTQSSYNDGQESRIQKLLKYSQNRSQEFKNEVLTQILKQLNGNKNDLYTLRLLHYLVVFCYCFRTDEEYTMTMINFLIFNLMKFWHQHSTILKYIEYVIPTLFRSITYLKERENIYNKHVLTEMKINALIFQYQIKVPITLSNGTSFLVNVDPYDNFNNLKQKVMEQLNINHRRLIPELFEFFEIQTKENQVFERMLFPLEGVWDVIHLQDTYRNQSAFETKKNQNQKKTFQFMFKPIFVYTVYPNDEVGISLLQSQIYFDTYISNLVYDDKKTNIQMLSHLLNILDISNIEDPTSILPLSFSEEESRSIFQLIQEEYEKNIKNKMTRLQSKFEYIQLAKDNVNLLGLKIPIKYCDEQKQTNDPLNYLMVLNSYQMSFYETANNNHLVMQYKYSQLISWGVQDKFIKLNTKDNKSHIINTEYVLTVVYYFNQVKGLVKQQDEQYYQSMKSIYSSINTNQRSIQSASIPQNIKTSESLKQYQKLYSNQLFSSSQQKKFN
ncbi:myosin head protein (macronuclear) [Tetrahymena thermophila SB210]|uniref:Myosin head protein n=2 Tax=Tetrahymena thermophila TaxID=5911 RepID=I7MG60_TETTS|nr:myosin head protein [Tetrahymena thermophila SB210]EAR84885.2 myosin head protein [Tetrahymena thermophila SB210]BAE16256.1 myosin 6 [Tetrahymena thermophila]|eukprot:XP_001032548.2 myosin head protein [Tetrahymena thermophila SB210]